MKTRFASLYLLVILLTLTCCDRPDCRSDNVIFQNHPPESQLYKTELARQIQNHEFTDITYWFKKYEVSKGEEHLYFYIQGAGICAVLDLESDQWQGMEQILKNKGISYRGAQFTGLKFEIVQDSLETKFFYKSHESIID